ncbi:MAG: hypothetical protein AAFX57_16200 [Bacteroidota bacterium]
MDNSNRLIKVRAGRTPELFNALFHTWGVRPYINEQGADFGVTCAVIEDTRTGQIHLADPKDVVFITDKD